MNLLCKKTLTHSFIAVLIPTAMASSLPLGSVPHATNTLAHFAGNSRPLGMILFMFATLTHSLPSLFSRLPPNLAPIAKFLSIKLKDVIKCFALSASAFGLGTLDDLKLAVTIHTICSGCEKINHTACLAIPMMFYVVAKLILNSFHSFIILSKIRHPLKTPNSLPSSSHSSLPSLIFAIMIYLVSSLIALTSILTLAKLSSPTPCLFTNSS